MNIKPFAFAMAFGALCACDRTVPTNPDMLKGANFVTTQDDVTITLAFDADEMRMHGRIVNNYNGFYTAEGNQIKFADNLASTMMMGPQNAMQVEREYYQFLPTVTTYEVKGNKLHLIGADREIVFEQVESLPE